MLASIIIFLISALGTIAAPNISPVEAIGTMSFFPILFAFNAFSVSAATNPNPGAGKRLNYNIYYVLASQLDVDNMPSRDADGVTITTSLPLLPGQYWHKIQAQPRTTTFTWTSEGEPGSSTIPATLTVMYNGVNKTIEEWVAKFNGQYMYVAVEDCTTGEIRLGGTKCCPMTVSIDESGYSADKTGYTLKFTCESSVPPAYYEGTIPMEPATVVAADTTNINVAAGAGQYQLTDNTQATVITTMTNAVHGTVYEILGSGGVNPATITTANSFELLQGVTWTGTAGAILVVKAYKNGASSWLFIEQSRT